MGRKQISITKSDDSWINPDMDAYAKHMLNISTEQDIKEMKIFLSRSFSDFVSYLDDCSSYAESYNDGCLDKAGVELLAKHFIRILNTKYMHVAFEDKMKPFIDRAKQKRRKQ